jgi:hypothetical protein
MRRVALPTFLALATASTTARADEAPWFADLRPGDRFFFGFYGGAALASAERQSVGTVVTALGPAVGWETAYLSNDFIGFGHDVEVMNVNLPDPRTTWTAQLGVFATLSIPLRWIQPYVGGWAGLVTFSGDDVSSGAWAKLEPLAGLNVYLGRNVRAFVQWRPIEPRLDEETSRQYLRIGYDEIVTGIRWSPDAFHEARGMDRFNAVWWSALASFLTWGLVSVIGA